MELLARGKNDRAMVAPPCGTTHGRGFFMPAWPVRRPDGESDRATSGPLPAVTAAAIRVWRGSSAAGRPGGPAHGPTATIRNRGRAARSHPGADRTAIVAEARLRLARSGYAALGDVRCEFERGVLYLRGHLHSHYLKQVAQATVADLEGADRVVNLIEVDPPGGVAGADHRVPRRHSLPPEPPIDEE